MGKKLQNGYHMWELQSRCTAAYKALSYFWVAAQWADWRWQQACKARWTNSHPNKAIEFHNVKLALSAITEIIRRDRHLIGLEETQPNWVVKNGQKIDSAWRIAEQKFSHVLIFFFRSFVWLWIPLYFFLDMVNECRKMQIHVCMNTGWPERIDTYLKIVLTWLLVGLNKKFFFSVSYLSKVDLSIDGTLNCFSCMS